MRRTYLTIFLALSLLSSGWVQASMVPEVPVGGDATSLSSYNVPDCHRQSAEKTSSQVADSADGCCDAGSQCGCASICQSASVFETASLNQAVYSAVTQSFHNHALWVSQIPAHPYRPPTQAI
jgi:hypothetical protein